MTALVQEKMRSFERWTYHLFPLAAGFKAWKHAAIGVNLATGKVQPATAGAALLIIGVADETVDATLAEKPLNVNLGTEIEVEWWLNAGNITAAHLGRLAFFADDQTVTLTGNTMLAGRIWSVDAVKGVGVQNLRLRSVDLPATPLAADEAEAPTQQPGAPSAPSNQPTTPPPPAAGQHSKRG